MKTIEISDEVFNYLKLQVKGFGETPDSILKSLLPIGLKTTEHKSDSHSKIFLKQNNGDTKTILRWKGVDFWEGMQLRFKGRPNEKAVVNEGTIIFNNKKFYSPSAAAIEANRGTSTNGWIHWEYLDPSTGTWKLIAHLREHR